MGVVELVVLSIGVAADAFAVSICKGLSMKEMNWNKAATISLYFGFFQFLMPLIGYLLGISFEDKITSIDHWIAFGLLGLIGLNMIKSALSEDCEGCNNSVKFKEMLVLAIATSIDALAVGITFAFLNINIIIAVCLIGVITIVLSIIGVKIGNIFGNKFEKGAKFFGGIILIGIGVRILLEHLNIL